MHAGTELAYAGFILLFMFSLAYGLKTLKFPYIISFMLSGFLLKSVVPKDVSGILLIFEYSAVALLFFFVGLEYSFERLLGMLRILKAGFLDLLINFLPIFAISYAFTKEFILSLVLASALYPSSTAITVKLFMDYKRLINPEVDLLIGILIFEDLICIIFLSLLTSFVRLGNINYYAVSKSIFILTLLFLLFYLIRNPVKVFFEFAERKVDENLFVFLIFGTLLLLSGLALKYDVSEALVAFIFGVLIPENSRAFKIVESSLSPLKELSVGLFFFFFTYKTDINSLEQLSFVLLLVAMSLVFKLISTYISSLVYGFDKRVSMRASLSFLQRGEFSLVFSSLYPPAQMITFFVVLITSLLGSFSFVFAPKLTDFLLPRKRSSKAPPQVP